MLPIKPENSLEAEFSKFMTQSTQQKDITFDGDQIYGYYDIKAYLDAAKAIAGNEGVTLDQALKAMELNFLQKLTVRSIR